MDKRLLLLGACVLAFFISSQKKQAGEKPPISPNDTLVAFVYPAHFPKPVYNFSKNPLSKKKIQLGRMLFYDPILSRDSTIACGSCHQPFAAFAQLQHPISHGIERRLGIRNAPGLFNLAWSPYFMWDGGVPNIEVQPVTPITHYAEMDETMENVLRKLNNSKMYKTKFKEAFGVETIESTQMLKAISQFLLTIVSANSKYDQYREGKVTLSPDELEGLKIVQQKCTPCHGGELFTDFSFRNIGLDSNAGVPTDMGRENFTKSRVDRRKFKAPTLRNFALTSPYMHDGSVFGLTRVLEHHDVRVIDNPSLDPLMKKDGKLGLGITVEERLKIYVFINTLTDVALIQNRSFQTPFDTYIIVH